MSEQLHIRGQTFDTLTLLRGSSAKRHPDGTVTTDALFGIKTSKLWQNIPRRGVTVHPTWKNFVCDDWTSSTPIKGITLLKVDYIDLLTDAQPDGKKLPPDVDLEAIHDTMEVPITTLPHFLKEAEWMGETKQPICQLLNPTTGAVVDWPTKDFQDGKGPVPVTVDPSTGRWKKIGGVACKVSNGAVFDTAGQNTSGDAVDYNPNVGRFLYFGPGPFIGMESVLVPRGEWSYSYASKTQPDLSNVGKIKQPAGLPAPTAPINYLLASARFRRSGLIYRMHERYLRSGPRGWNSVIYPTASAES